MSMRRFILLATGALMMWQSGVAAEPPDKWEGFRYATKVKPGFYQFLRDSVVIIETAGVFGRRTPSEEPDEWVDVGTVKPPARPVHLRDKRKFQIETCRRAGLKRCPVMKRTTLGTGFLLNGDTLVTCRHGFHNWLAWASRGNGVSVEGLAVPLRIRNDAGKVLYDSARAKPTDLVKLSFFNADMRINRPMDAAAAYPDETTVFNAKASDYVELKSPVRLAPPHNPPLRAISAASDIGGEVYLFGFPDPVKGYKGAQVNGRNLAGSHGRVVALIPERGVVRTSAYSNVGMSGGPLLAPDGSIVGVSCGAFGMEDRVKAPENVNATGILLDQQQLLDLWARLKY
jgi:hypothetical protein